MSLKFSNFSFKTGQPAIHGTDRQLSIPFSLKSRKCPYSQRLQHSDRLMVHAFLHVVQSAILTDELQSDRRPTFYTGPSFVVRKTESSLLIYAVGKGGCFYNLQGLLQGRCTDGDILSGLDAVVEDRVVVISIPIGDLTTNQFEDL